MKQLIRNILALFTNIKNKRKLKRKLRELSKKDPFIYK